MEASLHASRFRCPPRIFKYPCSIRGQPSRETLTFTPASQMDCALGQAVLNLTLNHLEEGLVHRRGRKDRKDNLISFNFAPFALSAVRFLFFW